MFKSIKIPFAFLVTGVGWALFSSPFITCLTRNLKPEYQDRYRSLNDFVFVVIIAFILYFEIKRHERNLTRSEEEYRHLFESNPNPMWIYNDETLRFIKVNKAAVDKYLYTEHEFLKMTVYDIGPTDDRNKVKAYLEQNRHQVQIAGIWQHRKGNGDIFSVSIISYPVLFNNEKCNLVMSADMTEILEKENKLQEAYQKIKIANEALVQINWSNSHELRKPLCSILGLVDLLKVEIPDGERKEMLDMVEKCSVELDEVLKHNSEKVAKIQMLEIN